jgi:hypothetical protein
MTQSSKTGRALVVVVDHATTFHPADDRGEIIGMMGDDATVYDVTEIIHTLPRSEFMSDGEIKDALALLGSLVRYDMPWEGNISAVLGLLVEVGRKIGAGELKPFYSPDMSDEQYEECCK